MLCRPSFLLQRDGGQEGTGPAGALPPSGLGGHNTGAPPWLRHDILAPEALECHRKHDSSEVCMSQACAGGLTRVRKSSRSGSKRPSRLGGNPPPEQRSSHAAPRRTPRSRWEQAAGQATLTPQPHALSTPGGSDHDRGSEPRPDPTGPARLSRGPGGCKGQCPAPSLRQPIGQSLKIHARTLGQVPKGSL